MPYTADGKTLMLDALRGGNPAANRGIATASLHTAIPNDSGSNEVAGGSYARKAVTVSAANAELAGSIDITNAPVFDVPAATTVAAVGFWSGEGTPKFLAYADVTDEVFSGAGTYTLTDADLNVNS
jgi:hypothetical protein